MRLSDFSVLTSDCYGTLIDWETGISEALAPWLVRASVSLGRDQILEASLLSWHQWHGSP
jgi:2-haloacid dehalogenase